MNEGRWVKAEGEAEKKASKRGRSELLFCLGDGPRVKQVCCQLSFRLQGKGMPWGRQLQRVGHAAQGRSRQTQQIFGQEMVQGLRELGNGG